MVYIDIIWNTLISMAPEDIKKNIVVVYIKNIFKIDVSHHHVLLDIH